MADDLFVKRCSRSLPRGLAVIACGVVGFLCALFLVLFIAYRMKKKDEGSYALGMAKVPPSAYQKQPPKEFYA